MTVRMQSVERLELTYPVTATDANGDPAVLAGVDVALLARGRSPDADTAWTAATYADSAMTVLVAGPDADPTDALVVPAGGADLWLRVTDNPEVVTTYVDRIILT